MIAMDSYLSLKIEIRKEYIFILKKHYTSISSNYTTEKSTPADIEPWFQIRNV